MGGTLKNHLSTRSCSDARVRGFAPSGFALLGVFFLARAAITFLPCESWGPSGYLCAAPFLFLPLNRSHTCVARAAFGESARAANRLDFLTFRSEKFTVDSHGYRNLPSSNPTPPQVVLFGSSFSLGMSLNDEETFSAQLNQHLGPIVYNASRTLSKYLNAARILKASYDAGVQQGWVLLELVDRSPYNYEPSRRLPRFGEPLSRRERVIDGFASLTSLTRRISDPFALTRVSTLVNMRLHNDRWLPNPYRDNFPEEELLTGRHMLFFSEDKAFFQKPFGMATTVTSVARLRDDLDRAGFKLAVILIPTGYTVYYPFLRSKSGPDLGEQYMTTLAEQLNRHSIPVFNSLPLLRDVATTEMAAGRLIYWPDDAHWNSVGCAAAASAAAPWLGALTTRQSPPAP